MNSNRRHIVVFSGGSAANSLVDVFGKIAGGRGGQLSYIIPISDNGGSSSELIRVFGGPGIGDVRSRLVRLIPTSLDPQNEAIRTFFNHRLSSTPTLAEQEWQSIVLGTHFLWTSIPSHKKELIRSFLNNLNLEIVKRARPSSIFNFQSASVGNLFLTGARLFVGSFESAIYLLGAITSVPQNVSVIPAINSNFSHHISAGLTDGTVIVGQNEISHPSAPTSAPAVSPHARRVSLATDIEDANLPGTHPTLRKQNITFAKSDTPDLPSPIQRIWYINPYGQEIRPTPNPKVLDAISAAGVVIYSIGSLYTSILPSLVLKGVGERVRSAEYKILILNGCIDRETRSLSSGDFTAKDFIKAIGQACKAEEEIQESEYREYVSHVVHLQGEGTPRVDKSELAGWGIETVRLYGRKMGGGGMVYDGMALGQALEAVLGRGERERGRRNTLER
ncbi:CofD-like protein [Glarea lozoyensis ATCC 20868]|uniref:CofD-like protein n=1 Tax=Glarea lozoyensis (strain ATCC 20868 / MF5171) TaxID=1116229 RepID=S3DCZ7_GLAL2|nr:CofD-like protein [Glarea lozoyensis ATCC 20868]EPE35605.1 CofD-like protein [Glarea lozoyensis ATCC 20868]